jgi:uncharacterized coiled-coil DUF342 family protein
MGLAMSEKDFVMAWLLAARAGRDDIRFVDEMVANLIHQAQKIHKQLEEKYHETDNGVHEM